MEQKKIPGKTRKTPGIFWLLLALCAVATVALLGYGAFYFFTGWQTGQEEAPSVYSPEDLQEYFQDFDATALAALVSAADPGADQATLAQGTGENYLSVRTQGQILHFDLDTMTLSFPQEQEGYDRPVIYTCRRYSDVLSPHEPALGYGEHLQALGCRSSAKLCKDADGDAQPEYLYVVQGFAECWGKGQLPEQLRGKSLCVYLDARENTLRVYSFCVAQSDVADMVWDNGMLHLVGQNGAVERFLLTEPELCLPDYEENTDALRRITRRYELLLEDRGCTRVRMLLADVSDAPGREILCCYRSGDEYLLEVLSPREGRLELVDRFSSGEEALYQLENSLVTFGNGTYRRFRYDEANSPVVEEELREREPGYSHSIAQLPEVGRVCFDPCGGEQLLLMEGSIDAELGLAPPTQLQITDAATGKLGLVTLRNADSTLNLRTGPSTGYDLMRKENGENVKLAQGSVVTVLEAYNIADTGNPVWVKIRFEYEGALLEGYASQRYIRLEQANRLQPGQQLQLGVNSDHSPVHWESSDAAVAKVDPRTGLVTAVSHGLVLITVTNEAGQTASCLVAVE